MVSNALEACDNAGDLLNANRDAVSDSSDDDDGAALTFDAISVMISACTSALSNLAVTEKLSTTLGILVDYCGGEPYALMCVRAGVIPALVSVITSHSSGGGPALQAIISSLDVLATLVRHDRTNADAVVSAGGLGAIQRVLASNTGLVHESLQSFACHALYKIAGNASPAAVVDMRVDPIAAELCASVKKLCKFPNWASKHFICDHARLALAALGSSEVRKSRCVSVVYHAIM